MADKIEITDKDLQTILERINDAVAPGGVSNKSIEAHVLAAASMLYTVFTDIAGILDKGMLETPMHAGDLPPMALALIHIVREMDEKERTECADMYAQLYLKSRAYTEQGSVIAGDGSC